MMHYQLIVGLLRILGIHNYHILREYDSLPQGQIGFMVLQSVGHGNLFAELDNSKLGVL